MINKYNFYIDTIANFKEVETPTTNPDYISESGSKYWYTDDGVIRVSDHWNDSIRSCSWLLNNDICCEEKAGFCEWSGFELKPISLLIREFTIDEKDNSTKKRELLFNIEPNMIENDIIKCFDYEFKLKSLFGTFDSKHEGYEKAYLEKIYQRI